MLSEWDMSGARFKRRRCIGTVGLLIYNTRNEELNHEKRSKHCVTCSCRLLKLSGSSVLLRDSSEPIHNVTNNYVYQR